ncbi:helix-turn-helix domain-containing protein [Acuticoccus sp. M5D2P5]|uniref:Crp/Fnr family transcriptional regulator n=1 Tax=Acuticoccus kalidii TaxID=2910977 RepID=UPI001F417FD8|nr:helix-turn-helix domain-containing protein [Acuticoccus kalidii]MCF3935071.1 helix-turn-helix domain-containing protein [Acuticoccus kalidii]
MFTESTAGVARWWPADGTSTVDIADRSHLLHEGDDAVALYEIIDGAAMIYRTSIDGRRTILGLRTQGALVGLSSGRRYVCSAVAIEPTRARRISYAALERAIDNDPRLARRLLNVCTEELSRSRERLLILGNRTALGRVAALLLELAQSTGGAKRPILLPLTRLEMGESLGLTLETVSRSMSRLRTAGIIDLPRSGVVIIRDRARLEAIADGSGDGTSGSRLCA